MEKYCIKTTFDNSPMLQKFLEEHSNEYVGYQDNWKIVSYSYFHFPQFMSDAWGMYYAIEGYKEINDEEFKQLFLKQEYKFLL